MSEEGTTLIPKAKASKLAWALALSYVFIFSIGSLATCGVAALTGKEWSSLTGNQKFIIIMAVIANWSVAMKDFIRQALEKMQAYYASKPTVVSQNNP